MCVWCLIAVRTREVFNPNMQRSRKEWKIDHFSAWKLKQRYCANDIQNLKRFSSSYGTHYYYHCCYRVRREKWASSHTWKGYYFFWEWRDGRPFSVNWQLSPSLITLLFFCSALRRMKCQTWSFFFARIFHPFGSWTDEAEESFKSCVGRWKKCGQDSLIFLLVAAAAETARSFHPGHYRRQWVKAHTRRRQFARSTFHEVKKKKARTFF